MYISQVIYKLYMHANNEKNFWENLIYYIHLFIYFSYTIIILYLFYHY